MYPLHLQTWGRLRWPGSRGALDGEVDSLDNDDEDDDDGDDDDGDDGESVSDEDWEPGLTVPHPDNLHQNHGGVPNLVIKMMIMMIMTTIMTVIMVILRMVMWLLRSNDNDE